MHAPYMMRAAVGANVTNASMHAHVLRPPERGEAGTDALMPRT